MKKRQRSQSSSSSMDHSAKKYQRQRSHQKDNNKAHYRIGPDLLLTKHYYFLKRQLKNIGVPYAVWNFCIKFAKRPVMTLVICENQDQINRMREVYKLNRPIAIVNDYSSVCLEDIVARNSAQIVLMSSKKSSILCGKSETPKMFNLILNVAFHRDIQHYHKIHQFFVSTGGTIISFIQEAKQLHKILKSGQINISEIQAEITEDQLNTELLGDLQFQPKPSPQSIELLRMLPFNQHEIAGKLFQLLKQRYTSTKSKHLKLAGYITYKIRTDVQFSSFKYIWNYLDDLPQKLLKQIKGISRFKDGKGVIFDAPEEYKTELDVFIRKQRRNFEKNNDHRFDITVVEDLIHEHPIQDLNIQEYKELQIKREKALRHKQQFEVFVGGLGSNIEEGQVRDFFSQNGVNALTVRMSKNNLGHSKGICFVLCEDRQQVQKAVALDGSTIGENRKLKISMTRQRR